MTESHPNRERVTISGSIPKGLAAHFKAVSEHLKRTGSSILEDALSAELARLAKANAGDRKFPKPPPER